MLPSSVERVPRNTAREVNKRIRRKTVRSIALHAGAGAGAIEQRLVELDREWDIERALALNFGLLTMITTVLGLLTSPLWLLVTAAAGGFLVLHALQGWCPPLPILRRLSVRTRSEIEAERAALKAIRGDFHRVPPMHRVARGPWRAAKVYTIVMRGGERHRLDAGKAHDSVERDE